jgi:Ser/Thr protein kinase RdoA (MazF antagonist)
VDDERLAGDGGIVEGDAAADGRIEDEFAEMLADEFLTLASPVRRPCRLRMLSGESLEACRKSYKAAVAACEPGRRLRSATSSEVSSVSNSS